MKKNKAAQELGRKSHQKRTKGMSKKQVSEYYRKLREGKNGRKTPKNKGK